MDHNVLVAITSVALAITGFIAVILMGMTRTIWSLRRSLNHEEQSRHRVVDNMRQALRITCAHDAVVAIRKFIEQEEGESPTLYIKTNDPDEPYVPYDLNLTGRWMNRIRVLLEREITGEERVVDLDLISQSRQGK